MTYSDEHKFIFIAIPKTGSGSIQNYLQNFGVRSKRVWYENHAPIRKIKETLGEERLNNYFKFAFVRNPWDRAVSLFYWKKGYEHYPNFEEWNMRQIHDTLYHEFIMDEKDEVCIDFIGRFENLEEDFKIVCKKIGIPPPEKLGHENIQKVPKRKHYTEYFKSDIQINRVRGLYTKTIDLLGYTFP